MSVSDPPPAQASAVCATHVPTLLRYADGSLVLSQRLAACCGHGPALEEDIALANIALDLLGQARLLFAHAGALEDQGRDEDALAFWRVESEFHNPVLCELPNGDFAQTCLRAFFYVAWQAELWAGLTHSVDRTLAAVAQKSAKETRYHCEHLAAWVVRLGDGTPESQRRQQRALDYLYPYANELFCDDDTDRAAAAAQLGPLPSTLEAAWRARIARVIGEATLALPAPVPFYSTGRQGRHSECFSYVLAEMQALARAHPGATW
ncbi:MAG: phenylacetate-CoA oxygenase subunit PaaI [Gammaproteobacteria bacterium]|nr:phenylacetate-CoA oxygenase subunit PaaI [Gammaproteobacteria bacterium]